MSATIEYVRFDTEDPAALADHREQVITLLRERYGDDFQGAHLARFDDGSVVDLIVWASREAAERAAEEVPGDPRVKEFFGRIGTVHEMRHAEVLHTA